jgi:osmotically-inducible protein OsmY
MMTSAHSRQGGRSFNDRWQDAYRGSGDPGTHRGRGPKGYRRSDERIREDVCQLLTDDPRIDASDIEVTTENCEVTLSGTVHARDDKRQAEDLAESVSGVRDVHNRLSVAVAEARGERGAGPSERH